MAIWEVLISLRSLSAKIPDLSGKMSDLTGQIKTTPWMAPLILTVGLANRHHCRFQ